jgi:acetyl esterase
VYRPVDEPGLPVAIYFHAGGFVIGSLDSEDSLCRQLANASGAMIVSVDYRLSPENKFPAAVDDAFAAVQWIGEHAAEIGGDPSKIAVVGDSVGGGLSTIVSILARDEGGPPIRLQVLVFPDVDWHFTSESWKTMGQGYFVTVEVAEWLRSNYFNRDDEWDDWRASPLCCPDLTGLPPALLIYPEYNPGRTDMEAYGRRLQDAGVPTTVSMYDGQVMGFWCMSSFIDAAREAVDEVGTALRKAFAA